MASQAKQSSSCIQLPVDSSPTHVTEIYMKGLVGEDTLPPTAEQPMRGHSKGNGNIRLEKSDHLYSQSQKAKGFETFLMTGEMIIHTNPSVTQKLVKQDPEVKIMKGSQIPRLGQKDQKQGSKAAKPYSQQQGVIGSPKLHSKIPGPIKNHHPQQPHSSLSLQNQSSPNNSPQVMSTQGQVRDFPFIQAPVAEVEELSDLSQSSCSESELGLESSSATLSPSLPVICHLESPSNPSSANNSTLKQAMEALGHLQSALPGSSTVGLSDTSFSEPLSSGDSGFVYDGHISDPDLTDRGFLNSDHTLSKRENFVSDETLTDKEVNSVQDYTISRTDQSSSGYAEAPPYQSVILDSSGEKFIVHGGNSERLLVRTSKSHENYLQAGTGIALVSIDIDDSLAYSLDTLTYHDSPDSSMDNVASEPLQTSRSLDNSPEKKSEKSLALEREFIPGFISFEDSKPVKLKFNKQRDDSDDGRHDELSNFKNFCSEFMPASPPSLRLQSMNQNGSEGKSNTDGSSGQTYAGEDSLQFCVLGDDADADSLYHQPSKAVDRPSAERLAKRLFHLEGFRKSDVSRHLCKKNDFSNLVAEEYLKFFEFQDDTLDQALRKFLSKFSLFGETQERERVLAHFSRRYMECNEGSFNSEDACHTLTCAIMLLNSDLHSQNIGRRMTCQEFIENLAELNDGEDFSKDVLKAIYLSIKNEPIEWAVDEVSPEQEGAHLPEQGGQAQIPMPLALGSNPFLEVPDPNKTTEYKKGYVMRKCCVDPDRRKTPLGKRGWKMLYAVLRDMILYQYKDEHQLKRDHFVQSTHNAVRIHHALATKASDYTKKQHVFRLQTADGAEYLFQTGDSKELQEWVDIINLVAASLSAPVLPGAVGSKSKFQRQLLPSSYTRLNLREQLHGHETKVQELENELHSHQSAAPEKGTRSSIIQEYLDKESYLEFEIKRFKTYVYLLQGKLMAFPELEPSLVETTIGEYEEMETGPTRSVPSQSAVILSAAKPGAVIRPVQRSVSDRTISSTIQG